MNSFFKNLFLADGKYKYHSEAVIISCYFNPTNSPYRLKVFNQWYESIKHLEHRITELVIGDADFQLPDSDTIDKIRTTSLLWHKEALLNRIIAGLPTRYKYVFWIDADVLFTNMNWLLDSVSILKSDVQILQPFAFCVHLNKDEVIPNFSVEQLPLMSSLTLRQFKAWRSYCANYVDKGPSIFSLPYDQRGHVGFAWGAKRELVDAIPLYDKALIGGADGIMAYASTGDILNKSIIESFGHNGDLTDIGDFSQKWYNRVNGRVGYVKGNLYHLWHGDIEHRNYLKRIQDFTPKSTHIQEKDQYGLYQHSNPDTHTYIANYFNYREVRNEIDSSPSQPPKPTLEFGGGSFGGAGAEGTYEAPELRNDTIDPDTNRSVDLTSADIEWVDNATNWDSYNTIS